MAEAPAMFQVGQQVIDQQKQALAPDPGPKPSIPRVVPACSWHGVSKKGERTTALGAAALSR
jgi:hypothetical protein